MIMYRINILPLINHLKLQIPDVTQPWYADNAGDLGTFAILEKYFDLLTCQGPERGYYPKPSKIIRFVRPDNLEAGKLFGERHVFNVCMGARYLGGYIEDNKSKRDWLRECTMIWENNVSTISETAGKYPQESYAAVIRPIQIEWIFLQRFTWDMGDVFAGVEKMIWETFLTRLFFRNA